MSATQSPDSEVKAPSDLMVTVIVTIPGKDSQTFLRPLVGLTVYQAIDALDPWHSEAACPLPEDLTLGYPVYVNGVEVSEEEEEKLELQPGDVFTITDP